MFYHLALGYWVKKSSWVLKIIWNFKDYLPNYETNTRLVCTYLIVFSWLFQIWSWYLKKKDIFVNFCKMLNVPSVRLSRGKF